MLVNGVLVDEDWCDHVVGSALIERSTTNGGKNAGAEGNSDKSEDKEKEGTKSKDGDDNIKHRRICLVYQQAPHGL